MVKANIMDTTTTLDQVRGWGETFITPRAIKNRTTVGASKSYLPLTSGTSSQKSGFSCRTCTPTNNGVIVPSPINQAAAITLAATTTLSITSVATRSRKT